MSRNLFLLMPYARLPFLAPADAGAGGDAPPAGDTPPPSTPPAGETPPAATPPAGGDGAKWWQSKSFTSDEQQWLAARGLTKDDVAEVLPHLVKGHRNAEQRLGKGLDSIMDKPGKDQPIGEWLKANAAALGLPDKEEGYTAKQPEFWPKDMPWDTELEGKARKIAFEKGVPPDVHQSYVDLFAEKMKGIADAADQGLAAARETMMTDLRKDWGEQIDVKITQAKQAAQYAAQQAGLGDEQLQSVFELLSAKTGDAGALKLFAAIGAAMGEDSLTGGGRGGSLAMTPAEARAELVKFEGPEGDYGKAFATNNTAELKKLAPRREMLTKLASS